jgi:hypothetical protein
MANTAEMINWAEALCLAVGGALVAGFFALQAEKFRSKNELKLERFRQRREEIKKVSLDFIETSEKARYSLVIYRQKQPSNYPDDPTERLVFLEHIKNQIDPGTIVDQLGSIQSRATFLALECKASISKYTLIFIQAAQKIKDAPASIKAYENEDDQLIELADNIIKALGKAYDNVSHRDS